MNGRERVLCLLEGGKPDRPPVMPITMQVACAHVGARYRDYCTDYHVLVEGQARISERFHFDYVNTMSDPAREAADCGARVCYFENQPVALDEDCSLLMEKRALNSLRMPDPLGGGRMHNGIRALALYKEFVGKDRIIEGWVEGPIAQAADLRGINRLMLDFYDDPGFAHDLLAWVTELELRFAKEQVHAGADIIGVGDAAASLVGPAIYEEFVWPYQKKLLDGLRRLGAKTRLHICGDTRKLLPGIAKLRCDILDVDSLVPISEARSALGPNVVLIGNLNPVQAVRDGSPGSIVSGLSQCHADAGDRFIIGAGCEVPPGTPDENLHAFHQYSISCASASGASIRRLESSAAQNQNG